MRLRPWAVFVSLALSSGSRAETIHLGADTWCPFNCDADARPKGYVVEIAEYALGKAGHKVDYKTMSWSRAVKEVVAGNLHGAVAAGDVDVKENSLIVGKETVGISMNCAYAKAGSKAKYKDSDDLRAYKKVALVQDYFYGDKIAALQKSDPEKFEVITGEDPIWRNVVKLKSGRVDLVLEDEAVMAYILQTHNEKGVVKIGCEPHKINLFLAFSPKDPKSKDYAAAVDAGVVELRKTGKLKSILEKYGLKDWK